MVVERTFRETGAERIYTAIVKVGFLLFEMCFKVTNRSNWAMSSQSTIEQTPHNVQTSKYNKLKKKNMTHRWCFLAVIERLCFIAVGRCIMYCCCYWWSAFSQRQGAIEMSIIIIILWPAHTKGVLSRWGRYDLQAKKWGTLTVSSTWLPHSKWP